MMLGFVVRRCAVILGHPPSAAEFAAWANDQRDALGRYRIFGREISIVDARVIIRHPGRLVTVHGACSGRSEPPLPGPPRGGSPRWSADAIRAPGARAAATSFGSVAPMASLDERREWVALPRFTGRAWVFTHDLAADMILPARAAGLSPSEGRGHLFADLDANLAGALAPGDILVGGENLGWGAGAGPAVAALRAAGFTVTIARSFGEEFARAAADSGLPALILDAPEGIRTGQTVRVDIDGGRVVNLSSGDRFPIRGLTEPVLMALRDRLGSR
jgi:3-isopropylmalate/(R)-2-methylmalate dehydratase small subunit